MTENLLFQRIENLSEELIAINSMVNIPSVIAVKPEELQRLGSLVCRCIKATLFVSIGSYEVICEEEVKQTGRKEGISLEDLCRKYTWRATETSVSFRSFICLKLTCLCQNIFSVNYLCIGFNISICKELECWEYYGT